MSDADDLDVLGRALELAGPPVAWRPDTPEKRAELAAITEAMMPAQMESMARLFPEEEGY